MRCYAFAWIQVRLAVDEPCFTNGLSGGAGVPGSKARLLAHFRELGWQDVVKVKSCGQAVHCGDTDSLAIYTTVQLNDCDSCALHGLMR